MEIQFERYPNIVASLRICLGQPRLVDTRISVSSMLSQLAGGISVAELAADYGYLSQEQILEAVAFAAEYMHGGATIPYSYKSAS